MIRDDQGDGDFGFMCSPILRTLMIDQVAAGGTGVHRVERVRHGVSDSVPWSWPPSELRLQYSFLGLLQARRPCLT